MFISIFSLNFIYFKFFSCTTGRALSSDDRNRTQTLTYTHANLYALCWLAIINSKKGKYHHQGRNSFILSRYKQFKYFRRRPIPRTNAPQI